MKIGLGFGQGLRSLGLGQTSGLACLGVRLRLRTKMCFKEGQP